MRVIILILAIFFVSHVYAAMNLEDNRLFYKIFNEWTAAFNKKDLKKSCELFSHKMIADYARLPQKNYTSICDGFKKTFAESQRHYQYSFKIRHIYRSNDLAAVRITWFLLIYEKGKLISSSQDEGMDIFQKNPEGKWQIVDFLSYESVDAHANNNGK